MALYANNFDSVISQAEEYAERKYQDRIKQLEQESYNMRSYGMAQPRLAGTNYVECCGTDASTVANSKKRDIKSLIAYYYKR